MILKLNPDFCSESKAYDFRKVRKVSPRGHM